MGGLGKHVSFSPSCCRSNNHGLATAELRREALHTIHELVDAGRRLATLAHDDSASTARHNLILTVLHCRPLSLLSFCWR